MLHAIGIPDERIPRLLVHGWWNIRGEKMSKSLGNMIDPSELADQFGVDALRYYLVRDIVTGRDSDFDPERLVMLYNTELANELGNLCNRALNMSQRYTTGTITRGGGFLDADLALQESLSDARAAYCSQMDAFEVSKAMEALNRHVVNCNQYAERMKPWELAKNPEQAARLATVLHHLVESVAHCTVLLAPVLPRAARQLAAQLNLPDLADTGADQLSWGIVPEGHVIGKPAPVFPRIAPEKLQAES
jgi:methionyl-tRNA synthetase